MLGRPNDKVHSDGRSNSSNTIIAQPVASVTHVIITTVANYSCLRIWNVMMGCVHFGLFLVTLLSTNNILLQAPLYRITFGLNYTLDYEEAANDLRLQVEKNNLTMTEHFRLNVEGAGGLSIGVLTLLFFGITSFFHFGAAFFWNGYYNMFMSMKMNPIRWFEYAITAPMMWIILAQTFGFIDVASLALSTVMIVVTMFSGFQTELISRPSLVSDEWVFSLYRRLSFMIPGAILFTSAVIVLIFTMLTTVKSELPSFVIPIVLVQFLLFDSFAGVLLWQQCSRPSRWIYGEYAFQFLSLFSKALLGIVLIFNVLIYEEYICVFDNEQC